MQGASVGMWTVGVAVVDVHCRSTSTSPTLSLNSCTLYLPFSPAMQATQ